VACLCSRPDLFANAWLYLCLLTPHGTASERSYIMSEWSSCCCLPVLQAQPPSAFPAQRCVSPFQLESDPTPVLNFCLACSQAWRCPGNGTSVGHFQFPVCTLGGLAQAATRINSRLYAPLLPTTPAAAFPLYPTRCTTYDCDRPPTPPLKLLVRQRGLVGEIISRFEKKGFKLVSEKTLAFCKWASWELVTQAGRWSSSFMTPWG